MSLRTNCRPIRASICMLVALFAAVGCGGASSDSPPAGQGGSSGNDAAAGSTGDAAQDVSQEIPDAGNDSPTQDVNTNDKVEPADDADAYEAPASECTDGSKLCVDHDTRKLCSSVAGSWIWKQEDCPAGAGCVKGDCVQGKCSDECNLGDKNAAKTCELFDLATTSWTVPDPVTSLHDRSRAYEMWLRRDSLAEGGVGSAKYADPGTWNQVVFMDGIGDSAIWTGTFLAAEALRLKATGDADARANIKKTVDTLHVWFNVEGDPGVLSRWAVPSGKQLPFTVGDHNCSGTSNSNHCNVTYEGKPWDYLGHISRDQYQGVMMGYALAYEALGESDEPTRKLIRDDVVELVQELMKERTVKMQLTYNGTPIPAFDVTLRFVVLVNAEMKNGAVQFSISGSNYADAEMWGFQEFTPDLRDIAKQIPLIGGTVPSIPRASSAIMLASFFRAGILVTEGVPGYEQVNGDIKTYYYNHTGEGGNVNDWMTVAATYGDTNKCGESYFGHNISMEPMYNLSRLEDDSLILGRLHNDVFTNKMWPLFKNTKNSFFSYIFAGTVPTADPSVPVVATEQLKQFPPPPRVRNKVDLTTDPKYLPHESGCVDQVSHTTAVDIADRAVGDFIWQRHPWGLLDNGDPAATQPGVDYLVAYWMARFHGFIPEDTDGKCLVWR